MEVTTGTTLVWAWPILLAAVAMLLTAVVNQSHWNSQAKKLTYVIVSAIVGTIYAIAAGLIKEVPSAWVANLVRLLVVVAIIIVCGQAVYKFLQAPLTAIETATSATPPDESEVEDTSDDAAPDVGDEEPETADDTAEAAATASSS